MEVIGPQRSTSSPGAPGASNGPRPAPPGAPLGFFGLLLALHLLVGSSAQVLNPVAGLAWTQLFAFLLPAAAAAAGANLDEARFLLLQRRPAAGQVAMGLLTGLACFAVAAPLVSLWSMALPEAWVRFFDLSPLFQGTPARRAALVAITALLAPLCEEVAFRGYLLSALRHRLPGGAALAASTALFAAMHLDPVRLPALALQGAVFGWLAIRTGSLWPAVAAHAANNGVASVLAAIDLDLADPSPPGMALALGLLASGAAGLVALAAAWRRSAPVAPPPGDAVRPRDGSRPVAAFSLDRLPARYLAAAGLGLALLAALATWKWAGPA